LRFLAFRGRPHSRDHRTFPRRQSLVCCLRS
jgi:hypothetical protein